MEPTAARYDHLLRAAPLHGWAARWIGVGLLCILPLLLNLLGFDFSLSQRQNPEAPSVVLFLEFWSWNSLAAGVCIGGLALAKYRLTRNATPVLICLALFLAGCLDAAHNESGPWSLATPDQGLAAAWPICRLGGLFLILTAVLARLFAGRGAPLGARSAGLMLVVFLIAAVLATRCILTGANFGLLSARTQILLGLAGYAVLALGPIRWLYRRQPSGLLAGLWVSMLPQAAAQVSMYFGLPQFFGNSYCISHYQEYLAHLLPLVGLVLDYIRATRELRRSADRVERETTDRRKAEMALRDVEALYQSLVNTLQIRVFQKDRDGRFLFVNHHFCQTLGATAESIIGKSDRELFPPHLADKYHRDDERVLAEGICMDDVEEHHRPGGTTEFVQILKAPLHDEQGRVIGVQGLYWDVTARSLADLHRKRSDARIRRLVDSNIVGVFITDFSGVVQEANDAFLQLVGSTQDDLANGQIRWDRMTPPEYHALDVQAMETLTKTGTCAPWEKEFIRPDGSRVPVLIGVALFEMGADDCICLVIDLTLQKSAELELKAARDSADAANRAKSMFLANMSHEIRTPMNAIMGMTDLVLESSLTREQQEQLEIVRQSSAALLGVINDILDFSKIEAGKLELESLTFSVRELVLSTKNAFQVQAYKKGLDLTAEVARDVPPAVVGDPDRLRQVLVNLLANAIKFTSMGSVSIRVSSVTKPNEAGQPRLCQVKVAVTDTGIGIPPDKQQRVFEAFEQVDSSMTRRYGGTGLGLTISNQIVRLMGGSFALESQLGAGSTFTFTILVPIATTDMGTQRPAAPVSALSKLHGNVLLVEDSPFNQQLAMALLKSWGLTVRLCDNGEDALHAVRAQAFDLILMDVQLPGMDGMEATGLIRADEHSTNRARTPIIALTAQALPGDREKCLTAGMDEFLPKPYKAADLWAAVSNIIARKLNSGNNLPKDETVGRAKGFELRAGGSAPAAESAGKLAARGWNPETAIDAVGGDRQLLGDVMRVFINEGPRLLVQLEQAIEAGDPAGTHRVAHSVRSVVRTFGAKSLEAPIARLESHGELSASGTPSMPAAAIAAARRDAGMIRQGIEALRLTLERELDGNLDALFPAKPSVSAESPALPGDVHV